MSEEMMQWNIREARETIQVGTVVLDGWELKKLLGKGGCGAVWLAEKNIFGVKAQSAVKVISIPQEVGDLDVMRSEGFSKEAIQTELRSQVEKAVREIRVMLKLQGQPAVVSCESFDVIQYEDDETWDVFIRMELLTPLTEWAKRKTIQTDDVIKFGIALSELLCVCEDEKILHRDIKPSNLFVDKTDHFKLGDFGLSRAISDTNSIHSKGVGTEAFMAPEVFNGGEYDHRADIYSAGLVMYWLLNQQSLPFAKDDISRTKAITMRLSGEKLPDLNGISSELNSIILKACDPDPDKRWQNAKDFSDALKNLDTAGNHSETTATQPKTSTVHSEPAVDDPKKPDDLEVKNTTDHNSAISPKKRNKTREAIGAIIALLVFLLIAYLIVFGLKK